MKQITRCVGCGKMVGVYKSYKVKVKERIVGALTGQATEVEYEGKICKECSANAGYKVRGEKS